MSHLTRVDSKVQYDEFFQKVTDQLLARLPAHLRHIKISHKPGDNWMVLKYPEFKYSQHELHLAQRSKHHASYFGEGPVDVLAFYLGNGVDSRLAWLEAMQPFIEGISQQLGKNVVLGKWGDNWVWLAMAMDWYESGERDAKSYSIYTARFIQVTYEPIEKVLNSVL